MITCEICGTQAEQHDHWRHLIMGRVAALEDVVTREPATDEQPASAGGAPKRCPHGVPSHLGCWNCTSHAVKVGDVVIDEPPAEQPSRQETGGGEHMNCAHSPSGNDACRDRAKAKAAGEAATNPSPNRRYSGTPSAGDS